MASVSCTTPRWDRIQPGMDRAEVTSRLGEPTQKRYGRVAKTGMTETWHYDYFNLKSNRFEPHFVSLQDGIVTKVEFDHARFDQYTKDNAREKALAAERSKVPSDVGTKCYDNSQCTSKRCVFSKCAGPNDCTGLTGAPCTSAIDCCSGTCNFGAMKCN